MAETNFSERVCDLLLEISSGKCSITEDVIRREKDPDLAAVLTGLSMLWDDLQYAAERRSAAEHELRLREARFRALFNQARVSIWDCDLSQLVTALSSWDAATLARASLSDLKSMFMTARVLAVNSETVTRFRAATAEAFIEQFGDTVADESCTLLRGLFEGLSESRDKIEVEGVMYCLDQTPLNVIVGISTATGSAESWTQAIITLTDVTPLHRAREAAEVLALHRSEELRRVSDEVERLFYAVSHDLRAPVRGVINLAEWAQEDLTEGSADDVAGHLAKLQTRATRLEQMMNDLLSFARVGKVEHAKEMVDVASLLEEIRDSLVLLPEGFRITWDDMPVMCTERTLLSQVLLNLIGNAIKHHDKTEGRIHVSVDELTDGYQFAVADDGPGIPEQYREKVFGMFSTLKPRDEVEGSGMGLAFVHKLVRHRNGTLSVDGNDNGGCTFVFTWAESWSADSPNTSSAPPKVTSPAQPE